MFKKEHLHDQCLTTERCCSAKSHPFVRSGFRKIARRLGAGPILIVKTDITSEIAVWLPVGGDGIGREAVIRISHGDARHDGLILGDVSDFAHDIRSGYALAIDDGAKAARTMP